MRLEKLAIQGFKSFADRSEFMLGSGITAIVGPNGSGKSNVIDAIRWVLGEQSLRTLRGECLEDIIFNGSNSRRPHGLAEVSLTFDNESGLLPLPYSEIVVTRRAYRSGSSEFLINGVQCRLRDIQDLFADTGMGRQGYAFIGQGKVDEVLSLSAAERHVFLEQAAGVFKWRRRKKETQDKLERTEQDLVRLSDILAELQHQRAPLIEEDRRAKAYLDKTERLKTLRIFVALREIDQLKNRISLAEEEYIPQRQQLQALSRQRSELESDLQQIGQEVQRLETMLAEQTADQGQRQRRLAGIEAAIANLAADDRERQVRQETAALQMKELSARLSGLRQQKERTEEELNQIAKLLLIKEKESADLAKKAGELEQRQNEISDQADLSREERVTLLSERAAGQNALLALAKEERAVDERAERAARAADEALARAGIIASSESEEERKALQLSEEIKELEARGLRLEEQLGAARNDEDSAAKACELSRWQTERLKAELKGLEKVRQSHGSYGLGPRSVLLAGRQGVVGSVAQLLTVPARYETAIETALGGAQQYLVTENDQVAAEAIAWLRETGKGWATFLPLNTIVAQIPAKRETDLLRGHNVIGWAAGLIQCADELRIVAQHLLGRVLVTADLDAARAAARAGGFRLKVVTLAGDVVNVGGSLSGGSTKEHRSSQLAEERRLRELAAEVAEAELRLAAQAETLRLFEAGRRETEKLAHQVQTIKQQKTEELALAASRRQECLMSARELDRTRLAWLEESRLLALRQGELLKEKEHQQAALQRLEIKLGQLETAAAAEEADKRATMAALREMNEMAQLRRMEFAALQEKQRQLAQRLEEAALAETDLTRQHQEARLRLEQVSAQMADAAEERHKLENEKAEMSSLLTATLEEQEKTDRLLGAERRKMHSLEPQLRAVAEREQQQRAEVHAKELDLGRLGTAYDSAKERLFDDYAVPLDSPIPDLRLSQSQARGEIAELTQAIDALGDVNLQAPQMLLEITERIEFLNDQTGDIQAARKSLQKLIDDIEKTVAANLLSVFQRLKGNFQTVFQELFPGGEGDLQLCGDDPRAAGLEIYAKLPGKRMQPLTLLSGGERALTAIAFLFSLLSCGTSTLAVLDEIDAPLDDANAERFLSYLERLAEEKQFILATHRKAAMARAHTLYGLSMGAAGISNLVSVDLSRIAG